MASGGKKKTTMAKLTRESRLRERRLDKQARKNARKYAAAHPEEQIDSLAGELDASAPGEGEPTAAGEPHPSGVGRITGRSGPTQARSVPAEAVAQALDA